MIRCEYCQRRPATHREGRTGRVLDLCRTCRDAVRSESGEARPVVVTDPTMQVQAMEAVLLALRRCSGIDTTDHETGETFRTLINEVLQ